MLGHGTRYRVKILFRFAFSVPFVVAVICGGGKPPALRIVVNHNDPELDSREICFFLLDIFFGKHIMNIQIGAADRRLVPQSLQEVIVNLWERVAVASLFDFCQSVFKSFTI